MSKCPECKTEMKALFVGEYCPNDCDKPEVLAKRKYEAEAKKLANNQVKITIGGVDYFVYSPYNAVFPIDMPKPQQAVVYAGIKKTVAEYQDTMCKPRIWVTNG